MIKWKNRAALMLIAAVNVVGLSAVAVLPACAQPVVPTNVIGVAQTVAQTATTVIDDAQAIWPVLLPLVPTANQAAASAAFDKAVFVANHAVLALNDLIQTAITANTPNPDFTAAISQVADAVAQVVAIVESFQTSTQSLAVVQTDAGVNAVVDMNAGVAQLRAAAYKK